MMNTIGAAFRCEVSKETMAVFYQYLANYTIEAVVFAIGKCIENCEKFPTVKLLKEYAGAYRKPLTLSSPSILQIEEFTQEEIERCKNMSFEEIIQSAVKGITDNS